MTTTRSSVVGRASVRFSLLLQVFDVRREHSHLQTRHLAARVGHVTTFLQPRLYFSRVQPDPHALIDELLP